MKSQIIHSFDSDIQKRILRVNEMIKSITPDNIDLLDSRIIELNDKLDALNYIFTGDSMINSVDTYKLNTMISKCKSRIMKFKALPVLTADAKDELNGDHIVLPIKNYLQQEYEKLVEIAVEIPEPFTGLQSFVVTNPDPVGQELHPTDKKKKYWYYKSERFIKFRFLRYVVNEIYILLWR